MWLLARTDRDGATEPEVLQTAVAFLHSALGEPLALEEIFPLPQSQKGVVYAVLGKANPVVVSAERGDEKGIYRGRPLPGSVIARSQNCDPLPTVKGTQPWWVRVGFDWRGSDEMIPWPMERVTPVGKRIWGAPQRNDWLLVEARFVGRETGAPRDWLGEQLEGLGDKVEEYAAPIQKAAGALVWGAVGLGVAALLAAGAWALLKGDE
jgi:hypothetical protein